MKLTRWNACALAAISFVAGSLLTARFTQMVHVSADSNRVFELRVYHAVPGKVPELETEFRDKVTKLFAKHDLKPVGFWKPVDGAYADNTFIYIIAHPSRDAAKQHWDAFRADPAFQEMMKAQQGDAKIVEKVDSTYMEPTSFSPMK